MRSAVRTVVLGGRRPVMALDAVGGVAPAFAYGIKQLRAGYTGPAFRVVRSSDSAVRDIGFIKGQLDNATLVSFLTGTTGKVDIWYDQSGNLNDALQTTDANRPVIGTLKIGGAISFVGGYFTIPATVSLSKRAANIFIVGHQVGSNSQAGVIQLGTTAGGTQVSHFQQPGTAIGHFQGFYTTTTPPQARPGIQELIFGAASFTFYHDGETNFFGSPLAAGTMVGGLITNTDVSGGYTGLAFQAAAIGYGRVLAAADETAIRAALASQFSYVEAPTGRLVWIGDSISVAQLGAFFNGYAYQALGLLSKPINAYQLGGGGAQINGTHALYAANLGTFLALYPTENRIVFSNFGTNDLTIGGRTAAQIWADIQTYCADVHASGGKFIQATILPNNAWNGTQQTTRSDLNTLIRANAGANTLDGIADFAADPTVGTQAASADTAKYPDGLHPAVAVHTILAPIAAAAVNALL